MNRRKIKPVPSNTCGIVYQKTIDGKEIPGLECYWCKQVSWDNDSVKFMHCSHCGRFFEIEAKEKNERL